MPNKILIIEDNPHKLDRIVLNIKENFLSVDVSVSRSFSSGVKKALAEKFDVIVIDMSLPTYDRSDLEAGGRNRPFGGLEIVRKLQRKSISSKILFITQYESFSDHGRTYTFETLNAVVKNECKDFFLGFIMYDSSRTKWKEEMNSAIKVAFE